MNGWIMKAVNGVYYAAEFIIQKQQFLTHRKANIAFPLSQTVFSNLYGLAFVVLIIYTLNTNINRPNIYNKVSRAIQYISPPRLQTSMQISVFNIPPSQTMIRGKVWQLVIDFIWLTANQKSMTLLHLQDYLKPHEDRSQSVKLKFM